MKTFRFALAIIFVGVFSFILGRRTAPSTPSITLPAPKVAIAATTGDQVCTQITHRYNPTTGRLEPVAHNDPLGIR